MKSSRTLLLFSILFVLPFWVSGQTSENYKLAKSLERAGRYEDALNLYNKMYNLNKPDTRVVSGISSCLKSLGRYEDLINFSSALVEKYPHQYNYRVELGKAFYLSGNAEKAFANWKKVYEDNGDNIIAYRLVAIALTEFRLFDQAIEVYQKILNRFEDQSLLYQNIANLYRAQLDYKGAVTNLLYLYKYLNTRAAYIKSQLVAMSSDDEAVQKIISAIQSFIKNEFSDDTIQEFLAMMYIKNKEYDKAFDIYKSMESRGNNPAALATYASLVEKNKVYKYAALAYNMLINSYPANPMLPQYKLDLARNLYLLALQQASDNQNNAANDNINKSVKILDGLSKETQIMFRIRSMELKGDIYLYFFQDLDQAIRIYQNILENNIRSDVLDKIKLKLGNTYILKNKPDEARKYYVKIQGRKFKNLSQYNLAELDYYAGKFSSAKNLYEGLISNLSSHDSLANDILDRIVFIEQAGIDSLALLEYADAEFTQRQSKKSEAAKKFLEIYQKANKLSFSAGIKAGILYKQLDKFDDSRAVLNNLIQDYPDHEEIDQAYYILGEIYFQEKKYPSSLKNFQKILLNYTKSFYLEQAREKARIISGIIDKEDDK